jgi:hypothetical protein
MRFYTPDAFSVPAETAFERYANIPGDKCLSVTVDEPEGVYLMTPGGERAYVDRPVLDDTEWLSRCLEERKALACLDH